MAHGDEFVDHVDVQIIVEDYAQVGGVWGYDLVASMESSNPMLEFPIVYSIITSQGSMKFDLFHDWRCQGIETYI